MRRKTQFASDCRLLTCGLCGNRITYLTQHLRIVHRMGGKEYKRMFPMERLCGSGQLEWQQRRKGKPDRVRCRLCGGEFLMISAKHLFFHAITLAEYRKRFPRAKVVTSEVRAAWSEKSRRHVLKQHADPKFRAALRRGIKKTLPLAWKKMEELRRDPKWLRRISLAARERYQKLPEETKRRMSLAGASGRAKGQLVKKNIVFYRRRNVDWVKLASRLEAVVAFLLDCMGKEWKYEGLIFPYQGPKGEWHHFLVDFVVEGRPLEVKGDDIAYMDKLWEYKKRAVSGLKIIRSKDLYAVGAMTVYNWMNRNKLARVSFVELHAKYPHFAASASKN